MIAGGNYFLLVASELSYGRELRYMLVCGKEASIDVKNNEIGPLQTALKNVQAFLNSKQMVHHEHFHTYKDQHSLMQPAQVSKSGNIQ
jgi:hypothetical protein